MTEPSELRAAFAAALSEMYGREVPAYTTLIDVCQEINAEVASRNGLDAERLGSLERVTAERHGAIRLGTPTELAQVARILGAMGMHPVGFYDLRDATPAVPVVSTAFRPIEARELARNPFRVFTSLLATSDRRFFTAELQQRLDTFLAGRALFGDELLALADRAEQEGGLADADATRFVALATRAFGLSREPIDGDWYRELEAISSVAADIGGLASTHINHLTPRVLDIDALQERMGARGITMIDAIQGPPSYDGPPVLLRQTSFRALDEPRTFRRADGGLERTALRVRFGEVEARGIALTARGRERYDQAQAEIATGHADPVKTFNARFPQSELELAIQELGFFHYRARRGADEPMPTEVPELLEGGWLEAEPIVYEDFLPRSAAGIFQSNLTGNGTHDTTQAGTALDASWMEGALGRQLRDPTALYDAQSRASLEQALSELRR